MEAKHHRGADFDMNVRGLARNRGFQYPVKQFHRLTTSLVLRRPCDGESSRMPVGIQASTLPTTLSTDRTAQAVPYAVAGPIVQDRHKVLRYNEKQCRRASNGAGRNPGQSNKPFGQ